MASLVPEKKKAVRLGRPAPELIFGDLWDFDPAPETADPKLKARYELFIDGAFVAPKSGKYFDSINPANEAKLAEIPLAGASDVDAAYAAAQRAFKTSWGRLPGRERAKYLFRIARLLQDRADAEGLEFLCNVFLYMAAGNDDAHAWIDATQAPGQLDPIHLRHREVGQNQVDLALRELRCTQQRVAKVRDLCAEVYTLLADGADQHRRVDREIQRSKGAKRPESEIAALRGELERAEAAVNAAAKRVEGCQRGVIALNVELSPLVKSR